MICKLESFHPPFNGANLTMGSTTVKEVKPTDINAMLKHQQLSWQTLATVKLHVPVGLP